MTFGSWRSWAWVPVGAVAVAGVLIVTTVDSGAASNVLVLNPVTLPKPCTTYEYGGFPQHGNRPRSSSSGTRCLSPWDSG